MHPPFPIKKTQTDPQYEYFYMQELIRYVNYRLLMADGGDGGAGGGEGPLCFSKKDSSTAIYAVQVYFSGWPPLVEHTIRISSQERPVKILTAPL